MRISDSQLKAFIFDGGLVKERDLEQAAEEAVKTGTELRAVLLKKNLVSDEDLKKLEAYILGIPFVNLEKETVDPAVLNIIPEQLAQKHQMVAFQRNGKELQVAMVDPDDIQTLEFIKKKAGLRILPRLTTEKGIQAVLRQYQKTLEAEFGEIIKKDGGGESLEIVHDETRGADVEGEDLKKLAEDLPVIKIADTFLRHAILQGASDIHVEPTEKDVVVRFRIDGILHDAMTLPKQFAPGIVARIKVMANLKIDEHRLPQDGRFKIETPEYRISFRVSILPVFDGEKLVLRLLPESSKGYTLEKLGFNSHNLDIIHRNIVKPTGIILVTGPTGSGKTTTLYTILDLLNKPGVNISTVEDPIEYRMPRINQTQVRPDIGMTFANGLRALLRQDPNIIMVGEIRDTETASLAINAALTGHLVVSTLHTNSAAGALPRLLDMKVEPFLIASTVNSIMAQRLVRTLHGEKTLAKFTAGEEEALARQVDLKKMVEIMRHEKVIGPSEGIKDISWSRPKKSEEAPDGYKGRIGIHEVLEMSEAVSQLVMKNATADEIEKQGRAEGMITMLEDGFMKVAKGITTFEEVLRVTSE